VGRRDRDANQMKFKGARTYVARRCSGRVSGNGTWRSEGGGLSEKIRRLLKGGPGKNFGVPEGGQGQWCSGTGIRRSKKSLGGVTNQRKHATSLKAEQKRRNEQANVIIDVDAHE